MILSVLSFNFSGSLTDSYDELGNHYVIPVYCISSPMNLIAHDENSTNSTASKESVGDENNLGEEYMVRCRPSTTCKDHKFNVRTGETVGAVKKRLAKELDIPNVKQRWFFGGKMLYDKMTIEETRVPRGYVIQVVLPPEDT